MLRTMISAIALSLSALPALGGEADFYGTWKIASAVAAPWQDPASPMVTDGDERYIGRTITVANGFMKGPDLLGCGATELAVKSFPFAGLFEGGLGTDPTDIMAPYDEAKARTAAEKLGFTAEPVESLVHGCSEIILHRMNDTTLVFGLDNRIFTVIKQ